MWIVKIALSRPYTFIILGLLILILSPVVILQTPTDIFPNIHVPVVAVSWEYDGLNPTEMEGRITSVYERVLTTTVDNIEHIESTTINGTAVIRIYLQPNASVDKANAQITAISQTILRQRPQGALPPFVLDYSASAVPVLQLGMSGNKLSEQQLNDLSINFLRTQLVTVPGSSIPFPYGGKTRQVMVTLNQQRLQSKKISANDVLQAMQSQNLVKPGGTAKIGQFEYDIDVNSDTQTVQELNDLPIKTINGTTIYVRDVATVSDGFGPQKNVVRQDEKRGVLLTIFKAGDASTIDVVNKTRQLLPRVAQTLPPELRIEPLSDQSVFVKGAVNGVIREAVAATVLTGLMILLLLGSWRSTLIIAVTIPLSILASLIALGLLHQTINIMTLGGLALAVGILVDQATVTSQNQPYLSPALVNNGTGNFAFPLELYYEVDLWGRVRRSVNAAKEETQAAAGDVETAKLSLHAELARDYYGLRSADSQEQLLRDTVTAYARALKLTEELYNGGAAPREPAARPTQPNQTPSKNVAGLDASHHTRAPSREGAARSFFP